MLTALLILTQTSFSPTPIQATPQPTAGRFRPQATPRLEERSAEDLLPWRAQPAPARSSRVLRNKRTSMSSPTSSPMASPMRLPALATLSGSTAYAAIVDCNGNGVDDARDIAFGTSSDCQGDGIPDECQIAQEWTYLYDDGTLYSAVGWPHEHMAWLASFEVREGHELVTEIEVAWGSIPPGSAATLGLWLDPNGDGDPADAVNVMQFPTTSSLEFTGEVVRIDVPDTFVGTAGSGYFVGVHGQFPLGTYPMGFDNSVASLKSSVVLSDVPIDPDNLISSQIVSSGSIGDGDWMLRAISCPTGHCGESVDIDFNGFPDVCQVADCNGNNIADAREIALGLVSDCDANGIPDECQLDPGITYGDADIFLGGVGTNHDYYAWLVGATIQPGGEVISSIEIAHGSVEANTLMLIGLWDDPNGDGDPADAQLIRSIRIHTDDEFSGQYQVVNIPDTFVGPAGTPFFVGALGEFQQNWFAAGFDNSNPDGRSWFISADTNINPNDLSLNATEYGLISQVCACDGDWTIRALSCTTGHCGESTDLNANGVPDECDPDCNANGVPDDLDLLAGTATDCNGNGVPDSCEELADCDDNGIPDLCQATTPNGLSGEYYTNPNLFGDPVSRIDANVAFDFDTNPPFPGQFPTDDFSVRWTGSLFTPTAGTYTFGLIHDDGVRLWINGQLLIDEWKSTASTQSTASIDLPAATEVHVKLEYFEGSGNALVELQWQPPGGVLSTMLPTELSPIYDKGNDGIPDSCQVVDCNENGVDDVTDIVFGTSNDLDGDFVPDECEPCDDCDGNRLPDATEAAAGPGLAGQYYATSGDPPTFTEWYTTVIDPEINFDWGGNGPSVIPLTDGFGIRWTGTLTTPAATGDYTFYLTADDGVRFSLDGNLLIDEWHPSSPTEYAVTVPLTGDTKHLVAIDYYESGGGATIQFRWSEPGGQKVVVPSSVLEPDTDLNGDGIPDSCASDCDEDGIIDALEADLNGNCVPDDCEGGAGYWRFEESGGTAVLDTTSSALNGVMNGLPVRVTDVPLATVPLTGDANVQALSLGWLGPASGGYVDVADVGGLLDVGDESFTFEAWVKLTQLANSAGPDDRQWLVINKPAGTPDTELAFGLLVQSGNLPGISGGGRQVVFRYGDGNQVASVESLFRIDDLDWHFVSVAYDATRRELRFGLDGDFDSYPFEKPVVPNPGRLLIGAHENSSAVQNQFLRGTIDEVRFTRAFLPEELLLDSQP